MFCRFGSSTGHPSGLGPDLVIVGMDAPRPGVNGGEVAVPVRADALGCLFVRKQETDHRICMCDLPQCSLLGVGNLDAQVCKGGDELAWGVEVDAWQLLGDLSG